MNIEKLREVMKKLAGVEGSTSFQYVEAAVQTVREMGTSFSLYKNLSKKFGVPYTSVKKGVERFSNKAYEKGDVELYFCVFDTYDRVSPTKFVEGLSEYIKGWE